MQRPAKGAFPLRDLSAALLLRGSYPAPGDAILPGRDREEISLVMQEIVDLFAEGMRMLFERMR